jgi:hypothetical protein
MVLWGRVGRVISVVNGYVCTNCADAAKARRGEDPHPDPAKEALDGAKADKAAGPDKALRIGDPAVVLGGALSSVKEAHETAAAANASQAAVSRHASAQRVDFFA